MKSLALLHGLWLAMGAVLVGCSSNEHEYFAKPTTKVSGTVTVDGKPPGSPIVVKCHPEGGIDKEHPSITQGLTTPDGNFHFSTYEDGDGVPPGSYKITFFWGKFNAVSGSYGGPDKLKNRYSKPEKTPIELQVPDGEPIDMGTIALTTK